MPQGRKRIRSESVQILGALFEFLFACGMTRVEITAASREALRRAENKNTSRARATAGTLATAALVLDAWHRDRQYLTSSGRPKAVPLVGPAPSVEALIRSQSQNQRPAYLARQLESLQLLRTHGHNLFKPASHVALLAAFDPLAAQHAARSLVMLLETIRENLVRHDASQRQIERIAEVPDLPVKQIPAFRRFTEAQGSILLRTVNDWLETRRAKIRDVNGETVQAGIHVHTYIGGPRATVYRQKKKSPRAKR